MPPMGSRLAPEEGHPNLDLNTGRIGQEEPAPGSKTYTVGATALTTGDVGDVSLSTDRFDMFTSEEAQRRLT